MDCLAAEDLREFWWDLRPLVLWPAGQREILATLKARRVQRFGAAQLLLSSELWLSPLSRETISRQNPKFV